MKLYNTRTRSVEEFQPLQGKVVGIYACGFTVYDYAHIGHMRRYIMDDVLRRTLESLGYAVTYVQNVTDVGHLSSDGDEGEDKMEKGAKKYGKTVWEVAKFYEKKYLAAMDTLGIRRPDVLCRATEHIADMIALIKRLEDGGHTYETSEAVYFDTTTFSTYGNLGGQKLEDKQQAVREEVNVDPGKKHPADFALWFKCVGRFADHAMHWESPWGVGFPGWHIECSAMAMKYLGESFDIHTGGIDHIPVHHENEIAQSEAATGKRFVNMWVHHAFLMVDGTKMSKSLGNIYTIDDVREHHINPYAMRLLFLQSHYRQTMNFTWDSAQAAQNSYEKLQEQVRALRAQTSRAELSPEKLAQLESFQKDFQDALQNDLNTPQAVAAVWSMLKSNIPSPDKLDQLMEWNQILGLGLEAVEAPKNESVPKEVVALATERMEAKNAGDFARADALRNQIETAGFRIADTSGSYTLTKI